MDHRAPHGPSLQRWEPPDVFFMAVIGDISEDEMTRLLANVSVATAGAPHVFGLLDMSRMGVVSPEARVVARNAGATISMSGTAIFGASFHHRVIALLINKAASLLNKDHPPVAFFATEAEARAWIDERRKVVLAKERRPDRAT